MNLIRAAELIGIGYIANDFIRNAMAPKRNTYTYGPKKDEEYSIRKTITRIICNKLEYLFEGNSYGNYTYHYGIQHLTFPFRSMAYKVLDDLEKCISLYGFARVSDYYESYNNHCLRDKKVTAKYTDSKYGWRNLSFARIVMDRHCEYYIVFPEPTIEGRPDYSKYTGITPSDEPIAQCSESYSISEDTYYYTLQDYCKEVLMLFSDGAVSTETGEVITNLEILIGEDNYRDLISNLSSYVDDIVYYRNNKLATDYEIFIEPGTYKEEFGPIDNAEEAE